MGDFTKIQWAHKTFNAWIGCSKVDTLCRNCYAEVETFARRERARGLELWGVNAARHVTSDANWRRPLSWNKAAAKAGERHRVFCASMADVFEDRPELVGPRARLWKMIAETPNLDWLLLTKRPENADRLARLAALHAWDGGGPDAPTWLPNIWLGTSVGTQATAGERIPHLVLTSAKVKFLSCEPLLERVFLNRAHVATRRGEVAWHLPDLDWVIIGGESGHKARPCDVTWIRDLVGQCKVAGVAPFVKQLGTRPVGLHLSDRKGGDPDEWPLDLRVREVPCAR